MMDRSCLFCGCRLASDTVGAVCESCRRRRAGYDPGHDPGFTVTLAGFFLARPNEVVYPLRDLGIDPEHKWAVNTAVRRLRRRGTVGTGGPMHIEGLPHRGGYVYRPQITTPSGRIRGRRRI